MKRFWGTFLYSVLAGFCIGLGGTVFLRLKDAFPGGNVVGAILFSLGLFTICTRGYFLYTGKVCYLFEQPWPRYPLEVITVWVGNLVGCCFIGVMERATTICGVDAGINVTAADMVAAKMDSPMLSLFLLGFLCNVFIFIAANGYAKNPHESGKYLAIFLGVSVFIICGTEHSIADMYYWAVSGVLFEQPGESFLCLLVVTAGNLFGGVFLPLGEQLKAWLDREETPA